MAETDAPVARASELQKHHVEYLNVVFEQILKPRILAKDKVLSVTVRNLRDFGPVRTELPDEKYIYMMYSIHAEQPLIRSLYTAAERSDLYRTCGQMLCLFNPFLAIDEPGCEDDELAALWWQDLTEYAGSLNFRLMENQQYGPLPAYEDCGYLFRMVEYLHVARVSAWSAYYEGQGLNDCPETAQFLHQLGCSNVLNLIQNKENLIYDAAN